MIKERFYYAWRCSSSRWLEFILSIPCALVVFLLIRGITLLAEDCFFMYLFLGGAIVAGPAVIILEFFLLIGRFLRAFFRWSKYQRN